MRKSLNPLTPAQVYRYAVQVCQLYLQLRDVPNVAGQLILTVLFAAAARISSLSDTCRLLRRVPDEHAVAEALYATLPEYDVLRRRVQAALHGHLPKALRRRPQAVAFDLTLLPYYGADRKTNPEVVRWVKAASPPHRPRGKREARSSGDTPDYIDKTNLPELSRKMSRIFRLDRRARSACPRCR